MGRGKKIGAEDLYHTEDRTGYQDRLIVANHNRSGEKNDRAVEDTESLLLR